jgi:beta-glucanase (GH16 family)
MLKTGILAENDGLGAGSKFWERRKPMTNIWVNWRFISRWKYVLAIVVLFLAGAGRANAQGCTGVSTSITGSVTWTPQWCQEFSANTVSAPDTTVWSFDLGNNGGWGNNEVEVYCGPAGYPNNPAPCPTMLSSTTNTVYLDGSGHLVIQPINNGGTWISTRMKTEGIENFQYGRIEASLKLPDTTNPGLWPAFWSLGTNITTVNWPTCGEADFMENWSPQVLNGPGPGGNKTTIHTALTGGSGTGGSFTFSNGQQANTAFHTYGVIWSANMMQFYVDTPASPFLIKTTSDLASGDTWPFNAQIFLLMNVAIGGTLGGSTATLVSPQPLMADYVRQYLPSAVTKPTLGNPPSITVTAGAATGNSSTFTPGLTAGTGYVYFSCSTNAPKASCSIATTDPLNTFVVNSSAAETVKATVTTTANSVVPPLFFKPKLRIWLPIAIMGLLVLTLMMLTRRMQTPAWRHSCALFAGLILVGAAIAGCGGGSSSVTPPPTNNGTPPGAYTVTVYAFTESNSSNGATASADANVSIPLTVN